MFIASLKAFHCICHPKTARNLTSGAWHRRLPSATQIVQRREVEALYNIGLENSNDHFWSISRLSVCMTCSLCQPRARHCNMVVARQQHAWEHKKVPSACGTATKHPKKPTLISLPYPMFSGSSKIRSVLIRLKLQCVPFSQQPLASVCMTCSLCQACARHCNMLLHDSNPACNAKRCNLPVAQAALEDELE